VNRWTMPLVTAALLAAPAVLLGWNALAIAAVVVAPWTATGPEQYQDAGRVLVPANAPVVGSTSAPMPSGGAGKAPTSAATRTVVVVHNIYPQPVEDDVSQPHPDDVRGTDSGPEPHPDASPVPVTDPSLSPEPAPEDGQEPAEGPSDAPSPSPSPAPAERQPRPDTPSPEPGVH